MQHDTENVLDEQSLWNQGSVADAMENYLYVFVFA